MDSHILIFIMFREVLWGVLSIQSLGLVWTGINFGWRDFLTHAK